MIGSTKTILEDILEMGHSQKGLIVLLLAVFGASILSGCATTRSIDPNNETHYDANYDFSDKKKIVDDLTNSLLSGTQLPPATKKPIMIVYPLANETSEHINTSGITDDIRMTLLRSGKYRFINEAQRSNILKEKSYQDAGHVDPSMQISQGKQLGADYILSGALRSIEKTQQKQIRLTKKKLVYYSLNLELTDLTTGEIAWADKVELAREASRPVIGW
jgi:uncharacterized protein (TIGR02722 family)